MKEFILLVRVPVTYSTEQANTAKPLWNMLTDKWKDEDIFISSFVFPPAGYVITEGSIKKEFALTDNLRVVSAIAIRAADLEETIELAKACPVIAQGGTIEVREVPPRVIQVQ